MNLDVTTSKRSSKFLAAVVTGERKMDGGNNGQRSDSCSLTVAHSVAQN